MNAQELAQDIVNMMSKSYEQVTLVNNEQTEDSVVEHVIDVDVVHKGITYNVHINVNRFSVA